MTELLFHSYHFPPIGGSGAQRPLKMASYLLGLGYRSTVVTGGGATEDRWAPEDRTLLREIPEELDVLRVDASSEPPATESRWRGRAVRWLGVPDRWSEWWVDSSVAAARDAARRSDLVYVWMQPYASARAGYRLARETGKPWVADLGDPWALDEMMAYPSALHRRRELRRMAKLLGTAAAIVMSTPEAVERLVRELPELAGRRVLAIPNGFDAAGLRRDRPPRRGDGKFRLVHTGYLHTELGPGVPRDARAAPDAGRGGRGRRHPHALARLPRRGDRPAARARAATGGRPGAAPGRRASPRPIGRSRRAVPCVRLHGYVDHATSIELMRTADLLFLPMQNLPAGVRATIVPGKTYEYLASRTPVLAAVPDGDARDILASAGNALLCRPDDVEGIAQALGGAIERFRAGEPKPAPDPAVVAAYEYRVLARRLADVFDTVLGAPAR